MDNKFPIIITGGVFISKGSSARQIASNLQKLKICL